MSQRVVAFVLLTAWLVWTQAVQAWMARSIDWIVPDFGLVLVFSVLARLETRDAPWLVLCALVARSALAVEPAVAIAAGLSLVVALVLFVRGTIEITMATWRGLFCGIAVFVFDAWLLFVHHVRGEANGASFIVALLALLPPAILSGAAAFVCAPFFAHLPGLTPLRRTRW